MNITSVNIHNIFTKSKLKAVASIVIDNFIEVHDIKVVQGTDRLFVGMPSRKLLTVVLPIWCTLFTIERELALKNLCWILMRIILSR